MRRTSYVTQRPSRSAIAGTAYLVTMVGGFFVLKALGLFHIPTATGVMAFAALIASVWLIWIERVDRPGDTKDAVTGDQLTKGVRSDHWRFGRWMLLSGLAGMVASQWYYLTLPWFLDVEAGGALRALSNLFQPVVQAIVAFTAIMVPVLVAAVGTPRYQKLVRQALLVMTLGPLAAWLFCALASDWLVELIYTGRYADNAHLLWVIGLQPAVAGFIAVRHAELCVDDRPDRMFAASAAALVFTLTIGTTLMYLFGLWGVVGALLGACSSTHWCRSTSCVPESSVRALSQPNRVLRTRRFSDEPRPAQSPNCCVRLRARSRKRTRRRLGLRRRSVTSPAGLGADARRPEGSDRPLSRHPAQASSDPPRSTSGCPAWAGSGGRTSASTCTTTCGRSRRDCSPARSIARSGFDIVHHVSFARYWMHSAGALVGAPFVFGPVGGGENYPTAFWSELSVRERFREYYWTAVRRLMEHDPLVQRTFKAAHSIIASGPFAVEQFARLGYPNVEQMSAVAPTPKLPPAGDGPGDNDVFRFVSIGRLPRWRGVHLGIQAFAKAFGPKSGYSGRPVEYAVIGEGADLSRLKSLARDLGVANLVKFPGDLPYAKCLEELARAGAVVHPALRDSAGVSFEALSLGVPIVCTDIGTPVLLVDDACGVIVPTAGGPDDVVRRFADVMRQWSVGGEAYRALRRAAVADRRR